MTQLVVHRGEVFTARLDPTEGSKLRKTRPVLIVSNDVDNRYSPVVLAAPLTEHKAGKLYPTEVLLEPPQGGLAKPSRVSCMQIRVLDKKRLCDAQGRIIRRWGAISSDLQEAVDEALQMALGII